ncbi:FHA domain-containing protein [Mixta hanseatica]|uniref:Type III secretion protein n=1 Tax=Mixta hanseatica TaxID=2872648 RepID=A0ABY4RCC2_9GAMM|nr:FHA domain-containing protein [Mixta hanseatica]UQY44677.1 type III secretion protein [Mixta hanseatica]
MFELRVLSGLHCGAALPLSGECWQIGASTQADLLLSDESLAGSERWLHRREDSWWLAETEQASDGQPVTLEEPFALAGVWLCVAQASTPWHEAAALPASAFTPAAAVAEEAVASGTPRWMRGVMFALLLLFSFTVVSWILQPTVAQPTAGESTRPAWGTVEDLRAPLQIMLRERDLANSVKITRQGDRLLLSGTLTKPQITVFNRMMTRFYARYSAAAPVTSAVRPLEKKLPFRIVQIATGSRANIVTDEGDRLFIGDQIGDLRLVSITDDRIEFSGHDPITVKW